jgi:hypothetical protein
MLPQPRSCHVTYTGDDRSIILLAFIYRDWLIIRPCGKDAAVVVDSGCDEFLSVGCVCEVGCARGIWDFS